MLESLRELPGDFAIFTMTESAYFRQSFAKKLEKALPWILKRLSWESHLLPSWSGSRVSLPLLTKSSRKNEQCHSFQHEPQQSLTMCYEEEKKHVLCMHLLYTWQCATLPRLACKKVTKHCSVERWWRWTMHYPGLSRVHGLQLSDRKTMCLMNL